MSWPSAAGGGDPAAMYNFNDYNPGLSTNDLEHDAGFQNALQTRHGRRPPPTAMKNRLQTGRLGTAARGDEGAGARPMTAVRAAGYSNTSNRSSMQYSAASSIDLEKKNEEKSPEEKYKEMERKIQTLVERSCEMREKFDYSQSLTMAKEASRSVNLMNKSRADADSENGSNTDLEFLCHLNLAACNTAAEQFSDALNVYQNLSKNKTYSHSGRFKVNIGNLYLQQGNNAKAIKQYKMALDLIPRENKVLRMKVMQNIGIVLVKMGEFREAIDIFHSIMREEPNVTTGFNLLVCHFIMGDKELMKSVFNQLLSIDLNIDEDRYVPDKDDKRSVLLAEAIRNDSMRMYEKSKRFDTERTLRTAAKLIAPAIEQTFDAGYDWCIDQVKLSRYAEIANDLEIDKKQKDFDRAIESLRRFERKDTKMASTAAVNLCVLHYLQASEV